MNDFELSYMYHARSRELIAQAEHMRRARLAHKCPGGTPRESLGVRIRHALRRRGRTVTDAARRFQLAK